MAESERLVRIRSTIITVPITARLRHADGCQWRHFVRRMLAAEADAVISGRGEMGDR